MINRTPANRLALQRGGLHLHDCGGRTISEFISEVIDRIGHEEEVLALLNEYRSRLRPDVLRKVGGDRFPRILGRVV